MYENNRNVIGTVTFDIISLRKMTPLLIILTLKSTACRISNWVEDYTTSQTLKKLRHHLSVLVRSRKASIRYSHHM